MAKVVLLCAEIAEEDPALARIPHSPTVVTVALSADGCTLFLFTLSAPSKAKSKRIAWGIPA
jgi:hypothetical protein